MAYLYRLIALCIFGVLPSLSWASFPATSGTEYNCNYGGWFPTVSQALAGWGGYNNADFAGGPYQFSSGCQAWRKSTSSYINVNGGTARAAYFCPANSTLGGTSCTCNSGFTQEGSTCVVPPNPCANYGTLLSSYNGSVQMVQGATSVCMGGCQVNFKAGYEGSDLYGAGSDGVMRGWVPIGQLQSADAVGACGVPTEPVAVPVPDAERPPAGTCPGEINGVTVNVPCSRTESKYVKASSENDGAGNTTTKAESKTTSCTVEGSCTTTTTTTTTVNGGAPTTTTKTTTEGKGKFCADNPGSKECGDGDGSAFGGSCDAGFICEGDAVQCAHAKETHLQNCKLNKDTPERQLYEASKGDEAEFDNDDVVNVGPSSFSQAPVLGAASCITDKSITVMGSTVSLPFSRVCEYLAMLGNVLMAVGFLLSGRIIMRG